ncbi:aldehyde dehydrogenase family protein [Nocardia sp. NPDC057663]|uniref:aldehyde dehydrogenase family protein n=1 Tax=Nocardia sp. NPDC057663 TaxID=3346201 RepID=UPI00366B679D
MSTDIPKLVAELRDKQPEWEALGVAGRVKWLRKYAQWLLDNEARLVDALAADVGKPRVEAAIEFIVPVDVIKYYTGNAEKFLEVEHPAPHNLLNAPKRVSVTHRPYPVVGVITPWNFPLGLSLCDAVPALLAGAAVVIKPASDTPNSVLAAVAGWAEIGAPPIFTAIASGGPAIVDEVDYVQFTGSTETGKRIAERCAQRLIPCGLELGGKDPAIVLADADLEITARGIAWGALSNAGQMCTSVERVYVEAPIYDEFVAKLSDRVAQLRRDIEIGPLVTEDQFALVKRHIDEALSAGARLTTGGDADEAARWISPAVLVDVDHTMACVSEESFGPLIPVMKVADEDEAVRLANDSVFGLSASVWTSDIRRGERIAARLEAGAVNINDSHANLFYFPAPMHGWKESGMDGRFGGKSGVLKYTRPQTVTAPRLPLTYQQYVLWFPYNDTVADVLTRSLRVLAATGIRRIVR